MKEINNTKEFQNLKASHDIVLAYFSHDSCNVCKVLKPKLSEAIKKRFPEVEQIYVNTEHMPELAGQLNIFTVPVVVVFIQGQESLRKSRSFAIGEVIEAIERPYSIIYEE